MPMHMESPLAESRPFAPPLLVCVDLQREHLTPGRRHRMADPDDALVNCRRILGHWRERSWPVVHLKRVAQAAWFNPASSLTEWLAEWEPRPGEIAFEHPLPSAYSSARFSNYLAHVGVTASTLIGFSLDDAILATVIEGYHRGHTLRVVADAVACAQPPRCDHGLYKEVLFHLLRNYAVVEPADRHVVY